jgi:hypothetical protein
MFANSSSSCINESLINLTEEKKHEKAVPTKLLFHQEEKFSPKS